jgi:hypothetical protein
VIRLALLLALASFACKRKEVPFEPPPKDDAAAAAADAAPPPDAPPAAERRTATKLAIGDHFTCAITSDAGVACWGKNADGQLGDGTTTDAAVPVTLELRGVKDLVLGTAHGCALLDDSSVACWGRINYGPKASLRVPTAVPGLSKVTRLFAVGAASCATIADESLVCWGDVDVYGHLRAPGGSRESRGATPSAGLDHVVALTANGALHMGGSVSFWRADGVPRRTALTGVRELASIGDEVCGLRGDGSVACVGPSTRCAAAAPKVAKPAPGTPKKKPAPIKKGKKTAAKSKASAKGKPRTPVKPTPEPVEAALPFEVLRLPSAKHLAFDVGLCVVSTAGRLECLAGSDSCKLDPPWPGLANVEAVTGHCARTKQGAARCWAVDRKARAVAAVAGVERAISIVASSSHACARLADSSVVCWGSNKHGALGRGEVDDGFQPGAAPVSL